MSDGGGWVGKFSQKILALFSQREVKTPLAFYFRLVGATVIIVVAALYFVIPERRFAIFVIGLAALGVLAIIVALFAWLNVKNLVYGESRHRAETRFRLGTEQEEVSAATLAITPGEAFIQRRPAERPAVALFQRKAGRDEAAVSHVFAPKPE